jgi:hypothetical protein
MSGYYDVWQAFGVFSDLFYVNDAGYVQSTVTDVHADPCHQSDIHNRIGVFANEALYYLFCQLQVDSDVKAERESLAET